MADKLFASEGFRDVDAAPDPLRFVRSMQSSSESAFMRARARDRLARSGLPQRGVVVDLGCGLGADTLMLAHHVAPGGGRAIGLDRSETMLNEARARPEAADLPVEFRQGDVHRLPFADGEVDACWVERVLIHAEAPAVVMSEMRRVLCQGGQAVIMEPDYRTLAIDAPDRGVSEFVAATFAAKHRNPDAGGALLRLALDAGFAKAEATPEAARFPSFEWTAAAIHLRDLLDLQIEAGTVTSERAAAWWEGLVAADTRRSFLTVITTFTLVATR